MVLPIEMEYVNRKGRVQLIPIERPYRNPNERIDDFAECSTGFSIAQAQAEAARCLHCPDPAACVSNCPVNNNIPLALWYVEQGEIIKAAEVYRESNPLPEICGRVCPDESSCATACVLSTRGKGIDTQAIEAFVTDYQRRTVGVPLPEKAPDTGKHVAVVGAGPAGLTVAEKLALQGHAVTVYDAMLEPGGLLVYGIPNFKLDKSIVASKAEWLEELGIKFVMNTWIGKDITLDQLMSDHGADAVFLGTGAEVEASMSIPGEDLGRVYGSLHFLNRANLSGEVLPEDQREPLTVGRRVAIIGGGDTATDCLRSAVRLGAEEVICYYRRTEAEMPGNAKERHHAEEEGVIYEYLTAPVEMLDTTGDGNVDSMRMIRMELGEPDKSGRRRPVPIEGSEYDVQVDDVVLAIGFWPDPLLGKTAPQLETHKWGLIVIDSETGQTSLPGVYAGGDNVTGPALVNVAIEAGKKAARAIHRYLMH